MYEYTWDTKSVFLEEKFNLGRKSSKIEEFWTNILRVNIDCNKIP